MTLAIDPRELEFRFIRGTGPGGQNINKVATAVELRFDVRRSSLPAAVKARLLGRIAGRGSEQGLLIIRSRSFRTQLANRNEAVRRLAAMVHDAAKPAKRRVQTQASKASKERRLEEKKRRSRLKQSRRPSTGAE